MHGKYIPSGFITVIFLSGLFLAAQGCVEYISEPLPPQGDTSHSLMLIIHGPEASPEDWPLDLQNAVEARLSPEDRQAWDIVRYGWEEYADNSYTAPGAGSALGRQIGAMLAGEDYDYTQIHFVAHGVGSFVAHEAAATYKDSAAAPARIYITYLDPLSTGNMLTDSGADFSESYLNSDDPAPWTGTALAHSHTFDVTRFIMRDLGTAAGHLWPINYYLRTVADDRLLYGFQSSPMINTPPVDFALFPAGNTTTLYSEVPIETVNLSTGTMDLPIRYTDATVINTFFEADRSAVEAKLAGTPFELAVLNGDRTIIGLGFFEYRTCTIDTYVEAGIIIPVVKIGDPLPADWFFDMLLPPLDRKMGFYVLHIPADSEVAVAAGIEIWGFNKILTTIDFSYLDSTINATIHDPDSGNNILTFSGTFGISIPTPSVSSLLYSVYNDAPMKTINHATGTYNTIISYDLLLALGSSSHAMAQNLRDMGVDGAAPTLVTVSTDYQSILYLGNPL